jgi:predicted Zn-dependent protease
MSTSLISRRGRPKSLLAPSERFLSQEACKDILDRVVRLSTGGGEVDIYVRSKWSGNARWARNEIISGGDTTEHSITITRYIRGASASAGTTRTDDASLRSCVQRAEYRLRHDGEAPFPIRLSPNETYLETNLWSDATFNVDAAARADVQRQLVEPVIAEGLLSAGYLEVSAIGNGYFNTSGLVAYLPETRAEFSVTVRNAKGTGAGWAGTVNKDWGRIDAAKISARALDKCKRSADPVAIEPGRYTVILEPQAVAELCYPVLGSLSRRTAERGEGPWFDRTPATDGERYSKIGMQVMDERVTISADPTDSEMPFVPFAYDGTPMRPVKWFDKGYLRDLHYDRSYALTALNKRDPLNNNLAFRMSGGTSSVDEMIKGTERGLLVTRLVNVRVVDGVSLLCSGNTSDGLWLIERGEVTRAVKNFRFRESPLFALNNLDSMGTPERVHMIMPTIVPPLKIKDFSMTSLADAV